jgi:hypothetical protein
MDSTMKDGPLEGDDARLAAMGHRPELQRSHSTWYDHRTIQQSLILIGL